MAKHYKTTHIKDSPRFNGEKIQNAENDDESLDITYFCTHENDRLNVVWELKPIEAPASKYGMAGKDPVPKIPMRLVLVIDASHSMDEPIGSDDTVTKLDKVKIFSKLLVKVMNLEDYLGIVTFGTKSNVAFTLKRMTPDVKEAANRVIDSIEVGGVTHLSAGLFAGIEQFVLDFTMLSQSRQFDDNMILFTDGMANEGITDTKQIVKEIQKKVQELKKEYNYDTDYGIKLSTIGTSGFLPELIYDVGRAFSSDAFYYLDDDHIMELNLFRPVFLRQTAVVYNVKIKLETLNGVSFDWKEMVSEFQPYDADTDISTTIQETSAEYIIHDISSELDRHIVCTLKLPKNAKKALKGKEIMKMTVNYKDCRLCQHVKEEMIPYSMVPRKPKYNTEREIVVIAQHCNRIDAVRALEKCAILMKRLERTEAKEIVQETSNTIKERCEKISASLESEESHQILMQYSEPILTNLEYCDRYLGDFSVRWDDAWAKLKGLQSSLSRETPSSQAVYADGAEMYTTKKVQEKINDLCYRLKELYKAKGLNTNMIDKYHDVIKELTQSWQIDSFHNDKPEEITLFGQFTIQG